MSVEFILVFLFINFEQIFVHMVTLEISSLCSYGRDMLGECETY